MDPVPTEPALPSRDAARPVDFVASVDEVLSLLQLQLPGDDAACTEASCRGIPVRVTADPANRLISVFDIVRACTGVSIDHVNRELDGILKDHPEVCLPTGLGG